MRNAFATRGAASGVPVDSRHRPRCIFIVHRVRAPPRWWMACMLPTRSARFSAHKSRGMPTCNRWRPARACHHGRSAGSWCGGVTVVCKTTLEKRNSTKPRPTSAASTLITVMWWAASVGASSTRVTTLLSSPPLPPPHDRRSACVLDAERVCNARRCVGCSRR